MAKRLTPLAECFSEVMDPRSEKGRLHELSDLLVLAVLAVIAGAEGWEDIEEFGKQRREWLGRFLRLPNGIPSHDTISRVFRLLKPGAFQEGFTRWIESLHEELGLKLVAIDGKTLRHSYDRGAVKSALHAVCAWSVANHVVLGQQACEEKSNEITAIPELLKQLELEGAVVTIDAMGCQKEIAEKIVKDGSDYVLALKGNREKLHAAVREHFNALHESEFAGAECRRRRSVDKRHGRLEQRYYYQASLPDAIKPLAEGWEGLRTIGQVISIPRAGWPRDQ